MEVNKMKKQYIIKGSELEEVTEHIKDIQSSIKDLYMNVNIIELTSTQSKKRDFEVVANLGCIRELTERLESILKV